MIKKTITLPELAALIGVSVTQIMTYAAAHGITGQHALNAYEAGVVLLMHHDYAEGAKMARMTRLKPSAYAIIRSGGEKGATAREIARANKEFRNLCGAEQVAVLDALAAEGKVRRTTYTYPSGRARDCWVAN